MPTKLLQNAKFLKLVDDELRATEENGAGARFIEGVSNLLHFGFKVRGSDRVMTAPRNFHKLCL